MSSDNSWGPEEERKIVGVVDSLAPTRNRLSDGAPWARLLVNWPSNEQQNIELTARHVRIIEDDENGFDDQDVILVEIHQAASGTPGIWKTEVAKFYVENQSQADWIRECFGFRRPGRSFGGLAPANRLAEDDESGW